MKSYTCILAFSNIWPCHKKGQGQLKVIFRTILIVLENPMLHTKFQGPSVNWFWKRRFLKIFYHIVCLGHGPRPFVQIFIPSTPGCSIWNLVSIVPVAFKEIVWNLSNMKVLGQRLKNVLDLLYSKIIIYSLRWVYSSICRPKSSTVSKKSYVLAFSHIWPCRKKWSRSTQGHHLKKLNST